MIKHLSHLPVVVDPSHGTGRWWMVLLCPVQLLLPEQMDLLIEVHPSPSDALSDGQQSLTPDKFQVLVREVCEIARAVGRSVPVVTWGRGLVTLKNELLIESSSWDTSDF